MNKAEKKVFKPNDGVVPALRRLSKSRTYRAFFMRKTTANLMDRLNEMEQDAMLQIALGHQMFYGNWVKHRQFKYGELFGMGQQDYTVWALDLLKVYREWAVTMKREQPDSMDVCISICANETSINKLSYDKKRAWVSCLGMFRVGLGEWVRVAGWL